MSLQTDTPIQSKPKLTELATVFFRLGAIAFGGPAAHIAMMDDEVVERRKWMTRDNLLDLIGVTNLLPGPNSTELAIHIGYEHRGWRGLFVAGSCFILPAMSIVWLLAVLYVRWQTLPQLSWLMYGIKPIVMAIIVKALVKLGKKAIKNTYTINAGIIAIAGYFAGFNEVLLLVLLGIAVMLIENWHRDRTTHGVFFFPFSGMLAQIGNTTTAIVSVTWGSVLLFFLKIGCVLYGSGYVLLAFLQRDLVEGNQWLTSQQLLDAVAIGQITPGPVLTTATFVGYLLAGNGGAIAGTVGIFLPAFLLVGIVNPWVAKLSQSSLARGFLDGVNAASLGLMAGVTFTLGHTALIDWLTLILAILSAIAVFRYKINPVWLVMIGGAIGFISNTIGLIG
ncbi:MAG: chromate transporter [Pleurocapsa sp.]